MLSEKEQNRIKMLRHKALKPVITYDEFYYGFYRHMLKTEDGRTFRERYGEAYEAAMEQVEPTIDSGELILGKSCRPLPEEQRIEWENLREYASKQFAHVGQDSHMAVDFCLLLEEGIQGISQIQ